MCMCIVDVKGAHSPGPDKPRLAARRVALAGRVAGTWSAFAATPGVEMGAGAGVRATAGTGAGPSLGALAVTDAGASFGASFGATD